VLASTSQPGDDGGLSVAEDPFGGARVQTFGKRREHPCDLLRRGFQTVQGGVASRTERGPAGLTAKRLDVFGLAMLAISHESVAGSVCDPEVRALLVGTSEACGGYALGGSPPAFDLAPGAHRCRGWFHAWRGETTDGAIKWSAGLEQTVDQSTSPACLCIRRLKMRPSKATKQRQSKEEEEHEQKQDNLNGHNDPRCLK